MPDFRFEGASLRGRPVQGVIQADSLAKAKKKIEAIAAAKRFTVKKINQRRAFQYRARNPEDNQVTTGVQKAFTNEEVKAALIRLGFTDIKVKQKMFDFRMKPPETDIVTFVRVSADLLREKLPFNEVLQLLVNDIENASLREAIKEINRDLQQGKDSEDAFARQERYLGKFTARMLGLASKSGNMSDIYESTATFLERNAEFKKNIKSALVMPMFTMVILLAAVVFYIAYIFPETASLFVKMGIELPPMTKYTLLMSDWLLDNMTILLILTIAGIAGIVYGLRLPQIQVWKDKTVIAVPVIGSLIHKTTIEIFCRVFYALYSDSGESIDAIKLASEACGNKYFEDRIKKVSIPSMLSMGIGLVQGFEMSGVFTKTALSRFHAGSETGTVKESAIQIANYYEKETVYKLKNVVEFIQIIVAMVIMIVMTALTIVSSETATIRPQQF